MSELVGKVIKSLQEEGIKGFASRTKRYVQKKMDERKPTVDQYKDVLFITGCREDLPHPWRYRVTHQREQLEAYGVLTDEVYFQEIKLDQLRYYRGFVFFRCPYTEAIGEFVAKAHELNKKVIYDIDDLVIDTKYTDMIPFVQSMKTEDKNAYDENVLNMKRLLCECDMAITTTECLAEELAHYVPEVYINRNTASEEMVKISKEALMKKGAKTVEKVRIGYFSGSITHNADLEMVLPALVEVLEKYPQVELCLTGELDLPAELEKYRERIVKLPFGDWRKLPEIIAGVDINLAPLEDTIFNCAKSENKWVEAALVKVPTVASDVGAFHVMIESGKTGVLCSTTQEWIDSLGVLIEDKEYRKRLAEEAYMYCKEHCTTFRNGSVLAKLFREKMDANYGFILPGLEISGGMKVALKHASILQKHGKDVVLFTLDSKEKWFEFEGCIFPVLSLKDTNIKGNIGCAIATMWTTLEFIEKYSNISRRCYLVQNFETDFYEEGNPLRMEANKTYSPKNGVEFLTISKWCQKWLEKDYSQQSLYAPNGLETERFICEKRCLGDKIRILIEGDCAVDYKNVDESFRIVDILDPEKIEVWYMSYNAEPKEWYKVDKFLHRVPYDKVPEVYKSCDVLLKTSLLESFSYPPLEMMATGGYVVAVPNGGNVEYMKNEHNCLFYPAGNIKKAKEQIMRIVSDKELQEKLFVHGRKTAEDRTWENIEKDILKMYVLD